MYIHTHVNTYSKKHMHRQATKHIQNKEIQILSLTSTNLKSKQMYTNAYTYRRNIYTHNVNMQIYSADTLYLK